MPIIRVALGIDQVIQMQFLTVVMLLIAGLMCGLTGMILMVRRQPDIVVDNNIVTLDQNQENKQAVILHACGFLVFTGIPLANFLACYYFWLKSRRHSDLLDIHGREAICQQITFYLYMLLCLFMALLIIGVFGALLLLCLHLISTSIAVYQASQGKLFRYPANIAIIDRKMIGN